MTPCMDADLPALCYSVLYEFWFPQRLQFGSVPDDLLEIGLEHVGGSRRSAPHGRAARYARLFFEGRLLLQDASGHAGAEPHESAALAPAAGTYGIHRSAGSSASGVLRYRF